MENFVCTHKVKYYETDKMGITHHSNYVRWMEEARIEYLRHIGINYKDLEAEGVISPVIGINCKYRTPTDFDDEIEIAVSLKGYSGVKFVFEYVMTNVKTEAVVFTATSEHCLINKRGLPSVIKKDFPQYDEILNKYLK